MGRKSNDIYLEGTNTKAIAVLVIVAVIVSVFIGILLITNLVSPSSDPHNVEVINFTKETPSPTSAPINSSSILNNTKDKGLKIHFLNVGQADCALIDYDGKYAFVDVGKSTKGTYYSTIRAHEPKNAEWVLASHQDSDHIGNIPYLMSACTVDTFYDNGVSSDTLTYRELMEKVAQTSDYIILQEGDDINTWNDVKITAVAVNSSNGSDLNDDSIVLRLEYDGVVVGFTGDIGSDVDEMVAQKLGDVDILKVSHHGAKTSTSDDFLKIVKPELSIISVGENTYGHPSDETISRLEQYGDVHRTDVEGCIEVIIENGGYTINKCEYA